jgi:hypothetical protein
MPPEFPYPAAMDGTKGMWNGFSGASCGVLFSFTT